MVVRSVTSQPCLTKSNMCLFAAGLTRRCWGEPTACCSLCPLWPLRRRGRLIKRPLQPMKTGGNNPDNRHIWSLSYKTNFSRTPFFKSSSGWGTTELNPCGCRICFPLIALSGYLTRWQLTKTPPFYRQSRLLPSSDTQNPAHNASSVIILSSTVLYFPITMHT